MRNPLALSFTLLISFQALAMPHQEDRVEVEIEIKEIKSLDYLIALPEGYDPNDKDGDAVPLLLFLHGAGERGEDLEQVKKHGPPKMVEQGHDFGTIVVSPQCPEGTWWTEHTGVLLALIDKVEKEHNVDKGRIYVTGLSMGGYGTFALTAKAPERFAAAVPICGGGTRDQAKILSKLPMWVFHGDADKVIPVDESTRMVKAMNQINGEHAKLTIYEGVGHNSWDRAYGDKAMWAWLFKQKR
ncbi:MAG: prolyl oligopeptidase family serine peptidase [Planctomycetota bacterium]